VNEVGDIMVKEIKNHYRVTVILDTCEQRESSSAMLLRVEELMESLRASVSSADDMGVKSLRRCPKRKFREGSYGMHHISAKPSFGKELIERLRLDRTVNGTFMDRI
jgi:ribosomal protein S6